MKVLLILMFSMCLCGNISTQNRENPKNKYNQANLKSKSKADKLETEKLPHWSMRLEMGILPISSINSKTIASFQGLLGMDYRLVNNFHIGIFGQNTLYHQNNDIANIDDKIIELSSIEYNSLGISPSYKFKTSKIIITPRIEFSYNIFVAKSIGFTDDKTAFLDYRYLSINPKINFGYAITDGVSLGLHLGFNRQISALKGKFLEEFNPNSINGGIFCEFQIK